ncbi:MAG: Hint domain-containing protein [Pseudomonadota bacterium]
MPVRRYDIQFLGGNGHVEEVHRIAPAIEAFESTCAAFAHGTLLDGLDGPIAIEDLAPGMSLQTRDQGPLPILWIGSITLVPQPAESPVPGARLTRVTESSMGLGRPVRDLVLGPHARLLRRIAGCLPLFGTDEVFAPATALADGSAVIEVAPVSPVRVFHIGFHGQQIISANGLEVESFHPGRSDALRLTGKMAPMFLGLFPHLGSLSEFGPMHVPRLSSQEYQKLSAR